MLEVFKDQYGDTLVLGYWPDREGFFYPTHGQTMKQMRSVAVYQDHMA